MNEIASGFLAISSANFWTIVGKSHADEMIVTSAPVSAAACNAPFCRMSENGSDVPPLK